MVRTLVPDGRTHRLSVVIAAMLQCSARRAWTQSRRRLAEGSVEASLLCASEDADPETTKNDIGDVVATLFRDARVPHRRVNARGDEYSIMDGACQEFVSWDLMPWE
jgi:hypothetical protein